MTVATVAEQLLYEIDDPGCYHTPDVDVDFTTVEMSQAAPHRVTVIGATGRPPSESSSWWRCIATAGLPAECWPWWAGTPRPRRGRRVSSSWIGCGASGVTLADSLVECLGAGDVAPGVLRPASPPFEVVLRVTVRDQERAAVRALLPRAGPACDRRAARHRRLCLGQALAPGGLWILARAGAACAGRIAGVRTGAACGRMGQGIASTAQIVNNSGRSRGSNSGAGHGTGISTNPSG